MATILLAKSANIFLKKAFLGPHVWRIQYMTSNKYVVYNLPVYMKHIISKAVSVLQLKYTCVCNESSLMTCYFEKTLAPSGREKMAAISQTTFTDAVSSVQMVASRSIYR